jgi:hypothetical protein
LDRLEGGIEVAGVELEEPSVDYINSLGYGQAYARNLDSINALKDLGRFDCIVLSEVFEHIEHPRHAFYNMVNALNTSGVLWFTAQATEGKLPIRPEEPIYTSYQGMIQLLSSNGMSTDRILLESGRWKVTTHRV